MENQENEKETKDANKKLDNFLGNETPECQGDECIINTDKSLVERINKKIIVNDGSGRQLL